MIRARCFLGLALMILGGCRSDEAPIGPGSEQIVVHAVLDPGRYEQRILLEHLLTGRTDETASVPFDSLDPIASRGGTPVSGANVIIRSSAGDSVVATERYTQGGRGTGVYVFGNSLPDFAFPDEPVLEIVSGRTYQLRVTPPDDGVVTAVTTVPDAPSNGRVEAGSLNRDRQSLFLFWDASAATARYLITVSSPRRMFSIFVDSVEFLVSGQLKHTSEASGSDVFVPGFTQDVTVAAVDENYHDYFRSQNDDVTGRGLLSHIAGGLGVFGSLVRLRQHHLRVTANIDHPLEGRYFIESGFGPSTLDLYVTHVDGTRAGLSGNYRSGAVDAPGLLGTLDGEAITLALLRGQSARDTAFVLNGTVGNGILRGQFRGGGDVQYRLTTPP